MSKDLPVDVATACPHRCWSNRPNSCWALCADSDPAVAIRSQPFFASQTLGVAGQVEGNAAVVADHDGEFIQEAEQRGQAGCIEGLLLDLHWKGEQR